MKLSLNRPEALILITRAPPGCLIKPLHGRSTRFAGGRLKSAYRSVMRDFARSDQSKRRSLRIGGRKRRDDIGYGWRRLRIAIRRLERMKTRPGYAPLPARSRRKTYL